MKKIVLGFLALILFLVLALLAWGMTLPSETSVVREVVIADSIENVQATIEDLTTWQEWSYWTKEVDPDAEFSFSGADSGKGAVWSWASEGPLGTGSLSISDAAPGRVDMVLHFDPDGASIQNITYFDISASPDGGTQVTWTLDAELDSIIWRITAGMGFLEKMVGEQYEAGLANLKERHEALPEPPAPPGEGEG
jgi:hypothetical protein